MAAYYGDYNPFETVRTLLVAELTALAANMVTNSTDPAILDVDSDHTGDPALTFPAVSVGITGGVGEMAAWSAAATGPLVSFDVQADIRVMIGNRNEYMDESKLGNLMASIVNWLNENRALDANHRIWGEFQVSLRDTFEDTDTIGGIVTVAVRTHGCYTAS